MNHNPRCGSFSSLLFFPHRTEPLPQGRRCHKDKDNDGCSSNDDDGDGGTCNNDNNRGSSSDDDDDGSSCLEPDGFHNGGGETGWKTAKRVRQWLHGFDNGQRRKWGGNNKKER